MTELTLTASNADLFDGFGASVALSADGTILAVGAPGEQSSATGIDGNQSDNSASDSGAVYIFVRSGSSWTQQTYIKASNTEAGDKFGTSVALSLDGNTLAVGAIGEDSSATGVGGNQADNTASESGAVYVFTRSGATWVQQAYIKASNTDGAGVGVGDTFGASLALSGDGNTLAVGAYGEDSGASNIGGNQGDNSVRDSGAAYVFVRNGATWSQQAYVKASNPDVGDTFGVSVSLTANGDLLAVGAMFEASNATGIDGAQTDNSMSGAGAAYVYGRSSGMWTFADYLKASNTYNSAHFGTAVMWSGDGTALLVGSEDESSSASGIDGNQLDRSASGAGASYLFDHGNGFAPRAYIKESNTASDDRFGWCAAISFDGLTLAVGAFNKTGFATGIDGATTSTQPSGGAAYTFVRTGTIWAQSHAIKAPSSHPIDRFGRSIALSSDATTLAIGAPDQDGQVSSAGAVYVVR